ncbi:MAG: ABC transporter permease [Rhodospirillaceae bacterium]|nr:ABC transporter permease [Rhodospirillaceae bacterium]
MAGWRSALRTEWSGLLAVLAAGAAALAVTRPAFLSEYNLYVVLTSFSLWSIVAMAQMVTLAVGQMNLAVGALGGLVAVAVGGLIEVWGAPLPAAVLAGLLIGLAGGAINGALVVGTGINGFIITLATLSAYRGIDYGITHSQPFYAMPAALKAFGVERWGAVPALLVVPLVVVPAMALIMRRTLLGRHMLAVGGNPQAAALSGIPARRTIVAAHVISGGLAAIAAMMTVARLQQAQPTIGSDWLILSFAAPIIGGAALQGGHVSVLGTCLGVLLVTLINDALVLVEIDPFWVQVVLGALILGAVGLNRLREGRRPGEAVAR